MELGNKQRVSIFLGVFSLLLAIARRWLTSAPPDYWRVCEPGEEYWPSAEEWAARSSFVDNPFLQDFDLVYGPAIQRRSHSMKAFQTVVHIGPGEFLSDRDTRLLKIAKRVNVTMVEPEPTCVRNLRSPGFFDMSIASSFENGLSYFKHTVIEAALCPTGVPQTDGKGGFFSISPQIFTDFPTVAPRDFLIIGSLCSSCVTSYLDSLKQTPAGQEWTSWQWAAFKSYFKMRQVPCISAARVLEAIGVKPDAVDMLLLDVEGYDTDAMMDFLQLEGFNPALVQFKLVMEFLNSTLRPYLWTMRNFAPVARKLCLNGYKVVQDGVHIMAWKVGE